MRNAARIARRELRGGLRGFRVFLACLTLGVAAIAAVGLVRAAIEAGLTDQGAVLLGGDAQMEFTYRFATPEEKAWMEARAERVSEVVEFRSMAVVGEDRALTQVKGVDGLYPLEGEVELDPPFPLEEALADRGLPGAVMDRVLADRLGLSVGESFRLGTRNFRLGAVLVREPDSITGGFSFGPRTLVHSSALTSSGLLEPGTLYETEYRLDLPAGTDLAAAQAEAEAAFRDKGMRWSDSRRASPGVERFVDRTGSFLVLVGLAGLAVGGVGISAAVRAYLEGKVATIATLRTLGAEGRTIFLAYLFQIGALTALGVAAGLLLGVLLPLAASPFIEASLPFPVTFGIYPAPLLEAAFYGILTAFIFTLWPLARAESVRAAALYRGRTALRLALASIGGPRQEATSVVLSLGLGLSVLAAVGQIDANLRSAIERDLPARAPSYFFVDIQQDQIEGFLSTLRGDAAVSRVEAAPMLRGVLTRINGRPAREVAGEHWVVRGDRGISYAARPDETARVVAGTFWPEDYQGPPQVSFAAEEAAEIGLKLGDRLTVNILGRDIEAEITSLREVDFSSAGMGFVMVMNPAALAGAPHTFIATVYAEPEAEGRILRELATAYPNITAIRVKDAIERVSEALSAIATATAWAAAATLVTGFVVLIGAAAAGERGRIYEAAVLKTLGATRARILASFALRSGLLGGAAGLVAILAGGLAGWAVMTFVMDASYRFEPVSALAIVVGGVLATLLAGLLFALRPLRSRPAQVLRAQE